MARKRNPARLVISLSVAAVLAIFLLYTSVAGGTASVQPSELRGRTEKVLLAGKVLGEPRGDGHDRPLRFTLRDVQGVVTVPVRYSGSVPELFHKGRDISVQGRLRNGVFLAERDTLVTKCPSKYTAKKD